MIRINGIKVTDQDVLQIIAEVLANTAAGAKHDELGSTHHRLYRLPVGARAKCFDRANAITDALALAGFRVERVSDGGTKN
jgi:hypothetical protein